jgi:hypothetical protein
VNLLSPQTFNLVGGTTRPGGDEGGEPPGAAGDAMDAGGVEGLGQGQIGEDCRQASGQPRCPRPGRPQEQDVGVTMPASPSASPLTLEGQAPIFLEGGVTCG